MLKNIWKNSASSTDSVAIQKRKLKVNKSSSNSPYRREVLNSNLEKFIRNSIFSMPSSSRLLGKHKKGF